MFKSRDEVETLLNRGVTRVVFEKKDGTIREMIATTNLKMIPKEKHPMGFGAKSETAKPVFDLEANAWRSFRWDSLIEVE